MNRNIRIARQLLKIAKSIVAFEHDDVVIGPFRICVRRLAVGNMRFPGDFVCVQARYEDIIQIKDELKRIGFRYDRDNGWICFWNRVNWNDVEAICNAHMARIDQNTAAAPVESGAEFEKDLTLVELGRTFEHENYEYGTVSYKKKFVFNDAEGNKYVCYMTNKSRNWHCDKSFWTADGKDFADDIDGKVGQTFHVHGVAGTVKKNVNNYEISFKMK